MTPDIAVPASETTAANGHGSAHSTAGFKALMLGSIGVVYGDIVLRVAALAEAGGAIGNAAMAGSSVYRAQPPGQRRHRLLPNSDGPGG